MGSGVVKMKFGIFSRKYELEIDSIVDAEDLRNGYQGFLFAY